MPRFYDISQPLCEEIVVWPGDPAFESFPVARIRNGDACNVSGFRMGAHTGTHLDAPRHLADEGADIADLPVSLFWGRARVFEIAVAGGIHATDLAVLDWSGCRRALLKTCTDGLPLTDSEKSYTYLHEDAARFLVAQGLVLVGVDAPSVDAPGEYALSAHAILLGQGVAILENACLAEVPPGDYALACLPLKLSGFDGSPVRAVLRR